MATSQIKMPPLSELKPVADFAEMVGVHRTTLFRFVTAGAKPGAIKLRAWYVAEWMTTEAEVRSFIERRTAAKTKSPTRKKA